MQSILEEIKPKVPNKFEPSQFGQFLGALAEYAGDSEFDEEPDSAREFAGLITDLLKRFGPELKNYPDLDRQLKVLSAQMRWFSPSFLDTPLRKELLGSTVVIAIKRGWSPLKRVRAWLDLYEFGAEPDMQRRAGAMFDLANNDELIGTNQIQLPTKTAAPSTVQNWIKDFIASVPAGKPAIGTFEKVQYLTANPNAVKLSQPEKDILSQVLDIYLYLKNPTVRASVDAKPAPAPRPQPLTKAPVAPVPKPISRPNPPKPAPPQAALAKSSFEAKLAAISVPAPHGEDLDALKRKIEQERKNLTPTPAPAPVSPQELKRELQTPELPNAIKPKPMASQTTMPKAQPAPQPQPVRLTPQAPKAVMPLRDLNAIQIVDDLKRVEVGHLRQGSIQSQLQLIKSKIMMLAQANRLVPYYAVIAFEQSPLFKAYLQVGGAMLHEAGADRLQAFKTAATSVGADLTLPEFEAIADLRKDIERL